MSCKRVWVLAVTLLVTVAGCEDLPSGPPGSDGGACASISTDGGRADGGVPLRITQPVDGAVHSNPAVAVTAMIPGGVEYGIFRLKAEALLDCTTPVASSELIRPDTAQVYSGLLDLPEDGPYLLTVSLLDGGSPTSVRMTLDTQP
ncbi:hypothetical protein NR798_18615 [Archangium gephyra]|uniref:hypothetical protein n=1 Tax=Archangium gephyra TaxID=48 RepID=UPI0035D4FAB2